MLDSVLKPKFNYLDITAFAIIAGIVREYGWLTSIWFIVGYAIIGAILGVWYETKTS